MAFSVQPPKLNEILKQNRDRKRASLQAAHQDTRISITYLQALEAGEYEKFPAEVYCIGFLRKYAAYLGLNPEEMIEMYRKEQEAHKAVQKETEKKKLDYEMKEKSTDLTRVLTLILVLVLAGSWWLYTVLKSPAHIRKAPAVAGVQPMVQAPVLPVPSESLSLTAFSREGVWMRVLLDKKLSFEGFIAAGSTRAWEARDEIFTRIGNVQAIQLTLNGQSVDAKEGAEKDVNEITFTRESLGKKPPQ